MSAAASTSATAATPAPADTSSLPVVDLDLYLRDPSSAAGQAECEKLAEALIKYGAFVMRSSSVTPSCNANFLDLLEDYFAQPTEKLQEDERPEFSYQAGATLANTEKPKCHSNDECQAVIAQLDVNERPLDLNAEFADPKCRFFYRMGRFPPLELNSRFQKLNMPNVEPKAFPQWAETCNEFGGLLQSAIEHVARMAATGLSLDPETFTKKATYGPHLLAPTATDLVEYGKLGAIFAGFHTDLNFLTIHGKSRYPGLHIWARNTGKRLVASVPEGCLLVQAGKQLEILSGGLVKAGYHEVVYNSATDRAVQKMKQEKPGRPLIRISSTLFWHLSSDEDITPLPALAERAKMLRARNGEDAGREGEDLYSEWKGKLVGEQVHHELGLINLGKA